MNWRQMHKNIPKKINIFTILQSWIYSIPWSNFNTFLSEPIKFTVWPRSWLTNKLFWATRLFSKNQCHKNKDCDGISPTSTRNLMHYWVGESLACAYCMSYSLYACKGILWTAVHSRLSGTCVSRIIQGVPHRDRDKMDNILQTTFFN